MDLDARQLAGKAFNAGKQHVKGTRDVMAYCVGTCDCDGDQDGRRAWFAYDVLQLKNVSQAFVAHMMRHHGGGDRLPLIRVAVEIPNVSPTTGPELATALCQALGSLLPASVPEPAMLARTSHGAERNSDFAEAFKELESSKTCCIRIFVQVPLTDKEILPVVNDVIRGWKHKAWLATDFVAPEDHNRVVRLLAGATVAWKR